MGLKRSRTLQKASPGTPKAPGQGRHLPGVNASEAVLDHFGGFDLESVQALWGSTLAYPLIFPFWILDASPRPQAPLESRSLWGAQGRG